ADDGQFGSAGSAAGGGCRSRKSGRRSPLCAELSACQSAPQPGGMLVVGDSKMSARTTRGTIAAGQDYYLTPLADKKDEPGLLEAVLEEWLVEEAASLPIFWPEDLPTEGRAPEPTLAIACAFEVTRPQEAVVAAATV